MNYFLIDEILGGWLKLSMSTKAMILSTPGLSEWCFKFISRYFVSYGPSSGSILMLRFSYNLLIALIS